MTGDSAIELIAYLQRRWPGWHVWRTSGYSPGYCAAWRMRLTPEQVAAGWAHVVGADDPDVLEVRLSEQPNAISAAGDC